MEDPQQAVLTFQKLREQLEAKREATRNMLIVAINDAIIHLKAIGHEYEVVEINGKPPKRGRPRKEHGNGVVQQTEKA